MHFAVEIVRLVEVFTVLLLTFFTDTLFLIERKGYYCLILFYWKKNLKTI